jgi:hypothetical protein
LLAILVILRLAGKKFILKITLVLVYSALVSMTTKRSRNIEALGGNKVGRKIT